MATEVELDCVLSGLHPAANRAAAWLREHLNVDPQCVIFDQFEQYFDCKLAVDDRTDCWMAPNQIVFRTPADCMVFLLRWS